MPGIKGPINLLIDTFVADVSIPQYAAVVQGASDYHATLATAENQAKFVGFAIDSSVDYQDSNGVGTSVPVCMVGTAWGIAAGAINAGDSLILAEADGKVESVGATSNPNVIGQALSTATADGDYVLVKIG